MRAFDTDMKEAARDCGGRDLHPSGTERNFHENRQQRDN